MSDNTSCSTSSFRAFWTLKSFIADVSFNVVTLSDADVSVGGFSGPPVVSVLTYWVSCLSDEVLWNTGMSVTRNLLLFPFNPQAASPASVGSWTHLHGWWRRKTVGRRVWKWKVNKWFSPIRWPAISWSQRLEEWGECGKTHLLRLVTATMVCFCTWV